MSRAQFSLIVSQMTRGMVALVVFSFFARHSSPQEFAYATILLASISVLADFVDFGGCAHGTRELSANRINKSFFFAQLQSRNNLLLPLGLLLFLIIYVANGSSVLGLLAAANLYLSGTSSYVQSYLVASNLIQKLSLLQISERFCWLIMIPLYLFGIPSKNSFMISIFIGQSVYLLFCLISVDIPMRYLGIGKSFEYKRLRSKSFGVQSIISDLTILDSLIVAMCAEGSSGGVYSYAQKFRSPLALGFNAISQEIRSLSASDLKVEIDVLRKKSSKFMKLMILGIIFLSALSLFFANSFISPEYLNLNLVLSLSLLTTIFVGLISIQQTVLSTLGYEVIVAKVTTVSSIVLLCTVAVGGYFAGAVGAAFGCLIINVLWYVYQKKIERIRLQESN